jgi:uncharacterized protein
MNPEVVLITGASSGIGLELARFFAADGSHLILVARSEDKLMALASSLSTQYGTRTRVIAKDLAVADAAQQLFDELNDDGTQVDVVVNNAAFGARGAVADLPIQRQLDMVQLNVAALTRLTLLFLPGMIARGRGGVLNVGSTAGFQPGPNMAIYYATKAFVLSFTEALGEELRKTPLRVSCLAPGPTRTGFAAAADMADSNLFKLGSMDAGVVARIGYKGFRNGRILVVPGLRNKFGTFMVRLAPRFIVRKFAKFLQRKTSIVKK